MHVFISVLLDKIFRYYLVKEFDTLKFIICSIEKCLLYFTLEFPILLKTICTMLIYQHEGIDKQRKRVYITLWLRLVYGRAIEFDFTLNENVEDMNKMILDPVCSLMHWITFTTASMKKKKQLNVDVFILYHKF